MLKIQREQLDRINYLIGLQDTEICDALERQADMEPGSKEYAALQHQIKTMTDNLCTLQREYNTLLAEAMKKPEEPKPKKKWYENDGLVRLACVGGVVVASGIQTAVVIGTQHKWQNQGMMPLKDRDIPRISSWLGKLFN